MIILCGRAGACSRREVCCELRNGLDRSANLPTCWGRLPHSVREMSGSDRGRPPPSAGGFCRRQKTEGERKYLFVSLPQSNALHLTALPSRGTRFCLRLGAPNKIDRFAHKCSLFPPPAAVTLVARRGRKRRAIRESPLQP